MLAGAETLLAGIWLGSYLFTTFVVSPALKALPLSEAERILTRSVIGRHYARLATPLLALWLLALLFQGLTGWTLVRFVLLLLLTLMALLHGLYLGIRMKRLAEQEVTARDQRDQEELARVASRRRALQTASYWVTLPSLMLSAALALLTVLG